MITNNYHQIGFQTESISVVNPTLNLPVAYISDDFSFLKLLINIKDWNSLNFKIWKVKIMKDWYGVIYKITNIQNNKCYIGKTIQNPYIYIQNHFKSAMKGLGVGKKKLYDAIRSYEVKNFKWEILGKCFSKEELNKSEIECISFFESMNYLYGYNMTEGGLGGGVKDAKRSLESKQKYRDSKLGDKNPAKQQWVKSKMSKSRMGKIPWNKGLTKKTDERIKEMSEKRKLYFVSQETKDKQSKAAKNRKDNRKGRHCSEQTKLKMSIARKNSVCSQETKLKMSISQTIRHLHRKEYCYSWGSYFLTNTFRVYPYTEEHEVD